MSRFSVVFIVSPFSVFQDGIHLSFLFYFTQISLYVSRLVLLLFPLNVETFPLVFVAFSLFLYSFPPVLSKCHLLFFTQYSCVLIFPSCCFALIFPPTFVGFAIYFPKKSLQNIAFFLFSIMFVLFVCSFPLVLSVCSLFS